MSGFYSVDVRAAGQECPHASRLSRSRACHQDCLTGHQCRVRVGARLKQALDRAGAAIQTGEIEWRRAGVVGEVGFGAGSQQEIHDAVVVAMDGPVKRRRAIALTSVDVNALLQKRPNSLDVSAFHRVDQP